VPSTSTVSQPFISSSSTAPVRNPRHWASKHKPRPRVADQRNIATSNISSLAERQSAYYEEKLVMERAEHSLRMQVLQMKKQLYAKKLNKFGEE